MKFKNREYAVAVSKINQHTYDIKDINFKTIPNGFTYWVADPFPFEKDGKLYIFGEMYDYLSLKGSIAYTVMKEKGFTKWKKIIEEPFHLSFPNIFMYNGELYMCPEARQSGELYLYKCIDFPEKWKKDMVLIKNTNCSDTIFYKKDNKNYALTCEWNRLDDHHMNLISFEKDRIFFAPKDNSKSVDNSLSRPAGKIFWDEKINKHVAVFQNCKELYGSGLVFKEFDLNFPNYEEKEIDRYNPSDIKCNINRKFDGVHTFNMSENYLVIDVIWSRFNLLEKVSRIIKKIRKVRNK